MAGNDDVSPVIRAPVYREELGLRSEVIFGAGDGLPQESSIRCGFLTLMFKAKLTSSWARYHGRRSKNWTTPSSMSCNSGAAVRDVKGFGPEIELLPVLRILVAARIIVIASVERVIDTGV